MVLTKNGLGFGVGVGGEGDTECGECGGTFVGGGCVYEYDI